MTNPNVHAKGDLAVAPGGGGAYTDLPVGAAHTVLTSNPDSPLGEDWEVSVSGPGSSVQHNLSAFADTSGKVFEDSAISATGGNITFPAGKGVALTAGATASERKGTFTLNGSGTHAKVLTTAAVTGSVICFTIVNLNGDAAPSAIVATIDTGVGFTPVSSNATAASIVNWAIVG